MARRRWLIGRRWRRSVALFLLSRFFRLHRADNYVVAAAFQAWIALDGPDLRQIACKSLQKLLADVGMGDFAAAELHDSLNAVSLFQEPDGVIALEVVVMIIRVRPEFDFLHLDDMLLLLRLMLFLLLLVLPLAIVHGFGDGWLGGGRYEDEVKTKVLRPPDCRWRWQYLDNSVRKDRADLSGTNRFVHVLANASTAWGKVS